ncbi:3-oxo-5-alpha-steroid 4-dehydrogenase-domain-containing protein [Cristinia sonorae]|uniref:very-long-chain enoyl-CoA reductase n=1 Tax=Cristinia sonorae TaxID=1940300 RepID=A0A8K0XQ32_9AGAR|nr:3-oxo-5-alpha-steroid 4-dehydrogenase-domain-containing protein [Cristinia sonorae]
MVTVTVSSAGRTSLAKGLPITVDIPGKGVETATVADVKAEILKKFPKFSTSRQKLALKTDKRALADEKTLKEVGVVDGDEVTLKDLGPQIGWRTVFLIEYAGPLLIHPIFYYFPKLIYGGPVQHSRVSQYVYAMVMLHFLKRELESIFVHRFSNGTMPFTNVFKNSGHYWLFSGVFLAYSAYSPAYSSSSPYVRGTLRDDPNFLLGCVAVWLFAELSNFSTHLTLRGLRPAGTRKRGIPKGYGFSLVSCPNYFFELLGWAVIAVMTGSYAAYAFLAIAGYIQTVWAIKKHRNYKKEFGKDYPRRKVIFPFIF